MGHFHQVFVLVVGHGTRYMRGIYMYEIPPADEVTLQEALASGGAHCPLGGLAKPRCRTYCAELGRQVN